MVSSLVIVAAVLACVSQAAAVAVEAQPRIVRRENEEAESGSTVQLSSAGEILRIRTGEEEEVPPHKDKNGIPLDPGDSKGGICKSDFILGNFKQDGCKLGNHTKVESRELCVFAARVAGLGKVAGAADEDIGYDLHEQRPKGCYMDLCSSVPDHQWSTETGYCYFWNDMKMDTPNNITRGTPVCRRAKYSWGIASPGDITNGCPGGYVKIDNQTECQDARDCNEMMVGGNDFVIGKRAMSLQKDYPLGCFFVKSRTAKNQDIAYFNPIDGEDVDKTLKTEGPGEKVKDTGGTPICKVKHIFKADEAKE